MTLFTVRQEFLDMDSSLFDELNLSLNETEKEYCDKIFIFINVSQSNKIIVLFITKQFFRP